MEGKMSINTVTGPISADELGKTLIHEHFLFGYPGYQGDITLGGFDKDAAVQNCMKLAEQLKSFGVRSIVDATPNDSGRDPIFLREVSEKTGLNIICSTGYYYEGEGAPGYFKFRSALGDIEKEIYDMFMEEITVGIGNTGIKAGIFKLASSKDVITDYEQTFFRAAAKVQQETGTSIITHTQEGTMGPDQAELLISGGADPKKISIGHIDGNMDIEYYLKTLSHGVFINMDRFGVQKLAGMPMDEDRIKMLIDLLSKDYANRIMISSDHVWNWLGRPVTFPPEIDELMADWSPVSIFTKILPSLENSGINKEQIETMLVENPLRFFS